MSRWRCARFPAGEVYIRTPDGRIVHFVAGAAVVDDADVDEQLRQVDPVFGLVEEPSERSEPPRKPTRGRAQPAREAP